MWGLIARSPSRLSAFKPSIPSAISHVKEVFSTKKDDHVGHNPAGAIMIWLMWTLLLGTAFTGWSIEQNLFGAKDIFESVHEVFGKFDYDRSRNPRKCNNPDDKINQKAIPIRHDTVAKKN